MTLTMHDKMVAIADKYCEKYGVTREDLASTYNCKGGKKKRVINGVNVSTIRMALGYYLSNNFPATLMQVAGIIGYNDHSTISYNNKKIYFYIKNQDVYFMDFYRILEEIGSLYAPVRFTKVNKSKYTYIQN
jgi:chromosomal replication initiation ATPase DnaA